MLTYTNHSATKRSARRRGQLNPQKTQAREAIKILNITLFQILPFKLEPEKVNSPTKRQYVSALNGKNYVYHTLFMTTGIKTRHSSGGSDVCGAYPVACVLRWGKALNKEVAVTL